ncbi:prepilin-type N-terminal cleavage/methylation domain-containing protein [Aureliella helgolandensis]|uniref:Type II secretion system protein G n=1 Tax=Aureliella helgolandensis TaxID=2527968 RepID=A0A518GHR3_9BACT|nr:prepilin-type N-terminal cleavage/methylation domain-containing protein [Aureliella helgolandensis]QDV28133.1 Type II secretion system protein G precursor [Aureliella helgolandensis]
MMRSNPNCFRRAFTLIELVIVIIIIAILAAVAVPKFIDRADDAKLSATKQSLSTLRSAIELYRADTGAYPATLNTDIITYLKGPFPTARIGSSESAGVVLGSDPMVVGDVTGAGGWLYNATSGEIRINNAAHFDF